ncbi:MAG TPA: hypothetical protein VLA05_12600 [Coriobacteriia bacterium]|nr:hypothetical protein [Coriobacteriia bacterium]
MSSKRSRIVAALGVIVGLAAAILFAASFPAVEGLGTKVRLPVFHGAATWVNLAAFALLGLAAVLWLARKREMIYRWEEALRWVSVGMWTTGTVLGLLAAMNTWDFTGSKSSRWSVVSADPRLMAQFWILLAGLLVVAVGLMIEDRKWLAAIDVGFVLLAWLVLLRAILGPGRALHPDSPVLNSEELLIKLLFFGIVGSLAVATLAGAWLIVQLRSGTSGDDLVEATA